MGVFSTLRRSRPTMRRRLFAYMLVLIAVILAALLSAQQLLGHLRSEREELMSRLQLQLEFAQRELCTASETLAAVGVDLSHTASEIIEEAVERQSIPFSALQGNGDALTDLQRQLIAPLRESLLRSGSSGAYILLNTTVNEQGAGVPSSCSGIYLQRSGVSVSDGDVLLYRGKPEVGKELGIMPHRKWHLESECDLFARWSEWFPAQQPSPEWDYTYSPVFELPGTSEQAMLLMLPVCGPEGQLYGIYGFEISQSYFKTRHAQPATLPHLSFLLYTPEENGTVPQAALSAGTEDGYYYLPGGSMEYQPKKGELLRFLNGKQSYAGVTRSLTLTPHGQPMTLAVLLPEADHDRMIRSSVLQNVLLLVLLLTFAAACCAFFSQRYVLPILHSLDQMKHDSTDPESSIQEIDDLFAFLAEKNRVHQNAVRTLEHEKQDAQSRVDLIQEQYEHIHSEYASAQQKLSRLSGIQLRAEEAEAYQMFRAGLHDLTPAEKTIFQYYMEGRTGKEILSLADIKESTLRYHNHNLYVKLGVKSLKQLLEFATILQENGEEA